MDNTKDNNYTTITRDKRIHPSRPEGKPLGYYCPLCGSPISIRDERLYAMCRTCAKEHYE